MIPVKNPEQLILFLNKQIDGAWTVEPWVSVLVKEGNGKVFLEESSLWPDKEYVTANIIVRKKFLDTHPDLVKIWLNAHVEITLWTNSHPAEAKSVLNRELKRLTGKALSDDVLDPAFARIKVTYDPIKGSLLTAAEWAFEQGFLGRSRPDLSGIYDLRILNDILNAKGLKAIE